MFQPLGVYRDRAPLDAMYSASAGIELADFALAADMLGFVLASEMRKRHQFNQA
jgi:hypothetical protein